MKNTLKQIIDIAFYDYGYAEYSTITETEDDIVVLVDVDDKYCDASIIFDLSGILQDIADDYCRGLNMKTPDDVYNLPYVGLWENKIRITFHKKDYENIVK